MSDERLTEAATLVDQIYDLNETCKEHATIIDALKSEAAAKTDRLRVLVEGTGLTEVAGSHARATFGIESVPKVVDWQSLYQHILETRSFDLLHKRIGVRAWQERVAMGAYVPGIEQVVLPKVDVKGKRR